MTYTTTGTTIPSRLYRGVQINRDFDTGEWWAEVKGSIARSRTRDGLRQLIRDFSNAPVVNWRDLV